jgi:hypothetical protein
MPKTFYGYAYIKLIGKNCCFKNWVLKLAYKNLRSLELGPKIQLLALEKICHLGAGGHSQL